MYICLYFWLLLLHTSFLPLPGTSQLKDIPSLFPTIFAHTVKRLKLRIIFGYLSFLMCVLAQFQVQGVLINLNQSVVDKILVRICFFDLTHPQFLGWLGLGYVEMPEM